MNSIVIANENVLADRALWSDEACVIYPEEIAAYKADFPEEICLCGIQCLRSFTVLNSITTTTIIKSGVEGVYFTLATVIDM